MLTKTVGKRIRDLRIKKGFTQVDLAKGICTPSMISQIESERANASYKILYALADKLDATIESLLSNVDLQLDFQSNYKMAKSLVADKEYAAAIPLLQDLLEFPRTQKDPSEVLFLLAECFLHTGTFELAESTLDKLKNELIFSGNSHLLSKVYNLMGLLDSERKQYEIAVYHFENALNELAKLEAPDFYLEAEIYLNFGRVRERQGKLKLAIELYARSEKLYEGKKSPQEMANVYAELARSYQILNEPERSIEYSDLAFALYKSIENMYMSVKVQLTAAIAIGQCGREHEAIQSIETVIKKFQELGKTEDVGIAYTELAKMQVALEDKEGASESCSIARSLLPELHLYQAWVNRILGEIEVKWGDRGEALRRFQMAGDLFKQCGEIGEWAETMAELSKLMIEEKDLSGALNIMESIRVTTRDALNERGIVL